MTVSQDKMQPCVPDFLIGNQTHFFRAAPTKKQSIASVNALQYQLGLCQYLLKSCEQQTKQPTEVSDNEMGLFQVRGVLTYGDVWLLH